MKHSARTCLLFLTSLAVWGCKTGAIGVEACRKVEYARCEAANSCGLVGSLSECVRFAHDNCLHGFGADTDPRASDVDLCVAALQAAHACVADQGNVTPARCDNELLSENQAAKVCDFVISRSLGLSVHSWWPTRTRSKRSRTPRASPQQRRGAPPEDAGAPATSDAG